MRLVADTHVHLYPFYDLHRALTGAAARLAALVPEASRWLLLTERYDCHLFAELAAGQRTVPGLHFSAAGDEALRVEGLPGAPLWLAAGRQIVTAERIEILALTSDEKLPDGLPARTVLERVRAAGGLPVLAWAPGKWFFGRGKLVGQLIDEAPPGTLWLGDTSLRPVGWPEPLLMRRGAAKGLRTLAGSDPLPVPGEEERAGTFATLIDGAFDETQPLVSLRMLLRDPATRLRRVGARGSLPAVLHRLRGNARSKRP